MLSQSDKDLRWGWMVGGGFEQAFTSNWSFKAEYNYSHFGNDDVGSVTCGQLCDDYDVKQHVHLVKSASTTASAAAGRRPLLSDCTRLELRAPGASPGLLLCDIQSARNTPDALLRPALRRYRSAMADPQPQATLPTAADVDAAAGAAHGRGPAHAADLLAGARRRGRRAGVPEGRDAPAHRLVQVPRRLQQVVDDSSGTRAGGVVAYSSGNHAQGVAAAAQILGMRAVIVMPSDAPRPKRERTAALGAEVVLYDRDREDRTAIARDIADKRGAVLVPPFDDPMVIAGQGTIGREIVEDLAALGLKPDVVVVGASGGGLIAGIALAIKARVPGAKFYSAEPEGFDDTARSFRSGKREVNARMSGTICDALMTNTPGAITFEINRKLVGEGISASDAEVGRAVAFAFRELKLVVEPGGAIGLAALLAGKLDVKGKVVVGVLSGGNVDAELFHQLIAA